MLDQLDTSILETTEAEQSLLGAILYQPGIWGRLVGKVSADDFFNPVHGRIFQKMADLIERGVIPTPITLAPYFENDEDLAYLGKGRNYLVEMMANVVTVVAAPDYANHIRAMAARRQLVSIARIAATGACDASEEFLPFIADLTGLPGEICTSLSDRDWLREGPGKTVPITRLVFGLFLFQSDRA